MVRQHFEPEPVEVLKPNAETVHWFTEVMTLMRVTIPPSGGRIFDGADWPQIEARRRLSKRRVTPEMVEGLDVMAHAYCQARNKRPT